MVGYLIETDWCIDFLKNEPDAIRLLEPLLPSWSSISVVTLGELYDGAFGSRDPTLARALLEQTFAAANTIAVDVATAIVFGQLRYELRRSGQSIPDDDLLIAATALRHDLTLVTRNRRHFARISDLRILAESD